MIKPSILFKYIVCFLLVTVMIHSYGVSDAIDIHGQDLRFSRFNPKGNVPQELEFSVSEPVDLKINLYEIVVDKTEIIFTTLDTNGNELQHFLRFVDELDSCTFSNYQIMSYYWNGRISSGEYAKNGHYLIELTSLDSDLNLTLYYNFSVDNNLPSKEFVNTNQISVKGEENATEVAEEVAEEIKEKVEKENHVSIDTDIEYEKQIELYAEDLMASDKDLEGNVVRWNIPEEITDLSSINNTYANYFAIENMFLDIFGEDAGNTNPRAIKLVMYNHKAGEFTIEIMNSRYWSDGEKVTASHYVDGIGLRSQYDANARILYDDFGLVELYVKDENSFVLKTDKEYIPEYSQILARPEFGPIRMDVINEHGSDAWNNPMTSVVNGPFKLKSFEVGKKIILERNEEYRGDNKVDYIVFYFLSDEVLASELYHRGYFDIVSNPALDNIKEKITDPTLIESKSSGTLALSYNREIEAFNKLEFRKALSIAIDREALVTEVRDRGMKAAHSLIPLDYPLGDQTDSHGLIGFDSQYDIARALLAKSGYPNGQGLEAFRLFVPDTPFYRDIGIEVSSTWKKELGIDVTVIAETFDKIQDRKMENDYDIIMHNFIARYYSPSTFFTDFYISVDEREFFTTESTSFAESMEMYYSDESSKDKSNEYLLAAENAIAETYIYSPLLHFSNFQYISNRLEQFDIDTFGRIYLKYTRVIKDSQ